MVKGYVLVEGMRVGTPLEGLPLKLLKIERYDSGTATTEQPSIWTTVEFTFEERDVERMVKVLSGVL